jgi:hypothetical protein
MNESKIIIIHSFVFQHIKGKIATANDTTTHKWYNSGSLS